MKLESLAKVRLIRPFFDNNDLNYIIFIKDLRIMEDHNNIIVIFSTFFVLWDCL